MIVLRDIASNLAADVIFFAALLLVGWILFIRTRRARLLRFFGAAGSRRLVVYISRLQVRSGGAVDPAGRPRTYSGVAVAFGEVEVADLFRAIFVSPLPALEKPGVLSNLQVAGVQLQILPSPLRQSEIDGEASIITLGSPGYSVVSETVERLGTQVKFDLASGAINVQGIAPITDTTYGFVERIVSGGRSFFYCAGRSELSTVGAAYYLTANWSRLADQYKDDCNFLVMLKIDPSDHARATVIFQR